MTRNNGGTPINTIVNLVHSRMEKYKVSTIIAKGPYLEKWFLQNYGLCGEFVDKQRLKKMIQAQPYEFVDLNSFDAPKASSHEPICECREHLEWMKSVNFFDTKIKL